MFKKKLIPPLLTLIIWFIMFYAALPPINIQSQEFWSFVISMIVVAIVVNGYAIIKNILENPEGLTFRERIKKYRKFVIIAAAFALFYGIGTLLSSPILRAGQYSSLLTVNSSNFEDDIKEADFSQIPILDKDSAALLSERKMGSMIDMVSQYEVSGYYSQINFKGRPVRVTPLEYGSVIKWLTNRGTGIPAYIQIDMTTQDVELVKLSDGIKISPSEHFGRNLDRYVRFRYPTAMFLNKNFEIDDNGTPYWICPVASKRIGLFGGLDVKGAVLLNAVTGEHQYYDVENIPTWIDKVYDAELLVQQYDYYGTLSNGYINSIFGQRGCLQTTEGYNYIALNDDVWVYTGITSVTGDESIVGFVLMNQRTKETNYYQISGAKEISAMSSAEGQVQHLGYKATFPLLLNVGGEPTYFLALKDAAGLVKKYAMVNIEKYQIVAIGDTISECEKNYKQIMSESGIVTAPPADEKTYSGKITNLWDVVIDGNTCIFIELDTGNGLYGIEVKNNLNILSAAVGDNVEIVGYKTENSDVIEISKIKINGNPNKISYSSYTTLETPDAETNETDTNETK
ncbi:CvpA family protein [Anaerotignum faecicola]|nr:CvpA family protein [Anaerotignum faecicola]